MFVSAAITNTWFSPIFIPFIRHRFYPSLQPSSQNRTRCVLPARRFIPKSFHCQNPMFPRCRKSLANLPFQISHIRLTHKSSAVRKDRNKEKVELDEENRDFLPWLQRKAGMKISSVLSIGKSTHGRTLIASKPICVGDCILKVPYSVQLTPNNLPPDILSTLGDGVTSVAKLALLILHEQKLGQASEWAPYISCLPSPDQMHSTVFWSDAELEMIRPSMLYQETVKHKMHIDKQFLAIKSTLNMFPEVFNDLTLKHFRYAFSLVTSRAWEDSRGISLIPFADFLNHDGSSESYVLSDDSHKTSEVIADRDYAPNDQVLIRYGRFSNATLLLDFGFTLHCNTYDQVRVELNTMADDPLSAMKLEILHKHHIPTIMDINGFASAKNAFIVKEVKSSNGKGRGIHQSMRAFARILSSHCTTQELSELVAEAAQTDGRLARRPMKNKFREIEAHELLYSTIDSSLVAYAKYIELPSFPYLSPVRRKLAMSLLVGELRVLKAASTWLRNYCSNLLGHSN